jgi:hypothetical protein
MCRPEARLCRFFPSLRIALLLLFLMAPTCLLSQTLSGTIQDSSGAVIVGARIEITGGDLNQPLVLSSDAVEGCLRPANAALDHV